MGCDIHLFVETKSIDPNAIWFCPPVNEIQHTLFVDRCYGFFSFFSETRNKDYGFKQISPTKGLPKDVSVGLKWRERTPEDIEFHDATWFTLKELESLNAMSIVLNNALKHSSSCVIGDRSEPILRYIDLVAWLRSYARKKEILSDNIRVVMFFDN